MDEKTRNTEANVGTEVSGGSRFFGASYSVKGNVSTDRKDTRSTDKSSKYTVSVKAHDKGVPPEGLSKVLQILSDTIVDPTSTRQSTNTN